MDGEFARLPDNHPLQTVLIESIDILLVQAATIRPDTPEAFAIKARIVQVYGDYPAGQMVADYLLCDLVADVRGGHATPGPNPDTALLALRSRLDAAKADVDGSEMSDGPCPATGESNQIWVERSGDEMAAACAAIVGARPAVTAAGRALKAAAAMHQFRYSLPSDEDEADSGQAMAWAVLKEIAGDVYVAQGAGEDAEPAAPALSPADPDAELLALRDQTIAEDTESRRLINQTDHMSPADPQFTPLIDASRATFQRCMTIAERASRLPALTTAGMRAKVAIALRVMPQDDLDEGPVYARLLRDVAGVAA